MLSPLLPVSALSASLPVASIVCRAGQFDVLDVVRRGVVDRRLHRVDAVGPGAFRDDVVGAVDHIGVVAGAAGHRVVAGAAVEKIVAASSSKT